MNELERAVTEFQDFYSGLLLDLLAGAVRTAIPQPPAQVQQIAAPQADQVPLIESNIIEGNFRRVA